jgi:hypothetical protein
MNEPSLADSRVCWQCKHVSYDSRVSKCTLGFWEFDSRKAKVIEIRRCLTMAQTCSHLVEKSSIRRVVASANF